MNVKRSSRSVYFREQTLGPAIVVRKWLVEYETKMYARRRILCAQLIDPYECKYMIDDLLYK